MNDNYNYVNVKISLKLLVKPLLHSVFSLITWITILNKTTCRTSSASPCQLWAY